MAGDGALLLDEKGEVHRIGTPKGKVVNSVGAGDSMVAGFVAGYLRSGSYLEACVWVPPAAVPLRSASGWQRRKNRRPAGDDLSDRRKQGEETHYANHGIVHAQSIALDEAQQDRSQIIDRLVELQATHGNIRDKEAYKKGLYEREDEGSTYVDNGITVPHAKCDCVTRPSLAALRLKTPVQYNAEDDGKTDLLFAIAAPKNGSLHVDMLARMMQMLMNEDFVEKLRTAKTPEDFLAAIDAQEEAQFGDESFTDQEIEQAGYRVLAVTACVNGIAHTYMAAEA